MRCTTFFILLAAIVPSVLSADKPHGALKVRVKARSLVPRTLMITGVKRQDVCPDGTVACPDGAGQCCSSADACVTGGCSDTTTDPTADTTTDPNGGAAPDDPTDPDTPDDGDNACADPDQVQCPGTTFCCDPDFTCGATACIDPDADTGDDTTTDDGTTTSTTVAAITTPPAVTTTTRPLTTTSRTSSRSVSVTSTNTSTTGGAITQRVGMASGAVALFAAVFGLVL